ncbi:hypothetical protein BDR05DRAFT_967558 [Suillus weaverae]|nr:hypothetical protein BDR05DRAFT_967558 [Suillus weaverae]
MTIITDAIDWTFDNLLAPEPGGIRYRVDKQANQRTSVTCHGRLSGASILCGVPLLSEGEDSSA